MKKIDLNDVTLYKYFIAAGFVLLLLTFLLGYYSAPDPLPKKIVCESEIAENKALSSQLETLRVDFNTQKTDLIHKITLESQNECLQKIDKYKAICETLRCEICKKMQK